MSFPSLPKSIFTLTFMIMAAWSAISHSAHANTVILFPDQSASLSWMNQKATDVMAEQGMEAAVEHMFTDQQSGRKLSYAEMRSMYG